eukprot:gene41645-65765_t
MGGDPTRNPHPLPGGFRRPDEPLGTGADPMPPGTRTGRSPETPKEPLMYKRALAAVGLAVAASTIASIAPVSAADSKTLTIADVLLADDKASGQANVLDRNW